MVRGNYFKIKIVYFFSENFLFQEDKQYLLFIIKKY